MVFRAAIDHAQSRDPRILLPRHFSEFGHVQPTHVRQLTSPSPTSTIHSEQIGVTLGRRSMGDAYDDSSWQSTGPMRHNSAPRLDDTNPVPGCVPVADRTRRARRYLKRSCGHASRHVHAARDSNCCLVVACEYNICAPARRCRRQHYSPRRGRPARHGAGSQCQIQRLHRILEANYESCPGRRSRGDPCRVIAASGSD
jgi:hypothetical protein